MEWILIHPWLMFLISNVVYANVKLKFSELVQVDKPQRGTNSGHHFHVHTRSKDADWKCVCPRSFRKQQVSITLSYESASQSCRGYVSNPGTRLGPVPVLSQQLILTLTDVPALSGGGSTTKRLQHPENAALPRNTPALLRRLSHPGGGVMLLLLGQLSHQWDNCPSAIGAPASAEIS